MRFGDLDNVVFRDESFAPTKTSDNHPHELGGDDKGANDDAHSRITPFNGSALPASVVAADDLRGSLDRAQSASAHGFLVQHLKF